MHRDLHKTGVAGTLPPHKLIGGLRALIALGLLSCVTHASHNGQAADVASRVRTLTVEMDALEFDPKSISVRKGETIRFVLHNRGEVAHDFTIGTPAMQEARRSFIRVLFDAGELDPNKPVTHSHNHPNGIVVPAGQTKELIWTFKKTQNIEFGCNIPLHYEGGMRGDFSINEAGQSAELPVADKTPVSGVAVAGVSQGGNGTVVINADNTVTYTPAPDFNGTDSFSYTVTTSGNVTEITKVMVTVNPVADAMPDHATTNEDTAITIDVLANDTFARTGLPAIGAAASPGTELPTKKSEKGQSTSWQKARKHKPTAKSTGDWVIQLASLRSSADATKEWRRISRLFPYILRGRKPHITHVHLTGRGTYHRLRIGAYKRKSQAVAMCSSIKERGGRCLVFRRRR